jgi:hypothetical protein
MCDVGRESHPCKNRVDCSIANLNHVWRMEGNHIPARTESIVLQEHFLCSSLQCFCGFTVLITTYLFHKYPCFWSITVQHQCFCDISTDASEFFRTNCPCYQHQCMSTSSFAGTEPILIEKYWSSASKEVKRIEAQNDREKHCFGKKSFNYLNHSSNPELFIYFLFYCYRY